MLSSMLLKDDDVEVYVESLTFLKFIVAGLAPHLSSLDLHLMIGSFINAIVNHNNGDNVRILLASNKVIIFFAKHTNIGSYIVAKEIVKLIERSNRSQQNQDEDKAKIDQSLKLYNIL